MRSSRATGWAGGSRRTVGYPEATLHEHDASLASSSILVLVTGRHLLYLVELSAVLGIIAPPHPNTPYFIYQASFSSRTWVAGGATLLRLHLLKAPLL